ncbi:hypothetical protein LT330_008522 [Penicillium expansum]|nr:hypothetical protein LT330_008522 [Penicillium expansum]
MGWSWEYLTDPYKWEKEAAREIITEPRLGKPHGPSLPLREQPLNVSLRELSGWNSASKIGSQYGHFLPTKILWKYSQVKDLANMNTGVCEALDLPNWAKATAQDTRKILPQIAAQFRPWLQTQIPSVAAHPPVAQSAAARVAGRLSSPPTAAQPNTTPSASRTLSSQYDNNSSDPPPKKPVSDDLHTTAAIDRVDGLFRWSFQIVFLG